MSSREPTWYEANQRHLMAAVGEVREAVERHLGRPETGKTDPAAWTAQPEPALDSLCSAFGLSSFERGILLLCAGTELDSRFAGLLAEASPEPRRAQPTFSLALAAFPDAHWSALSPSGPLRHWMLIEVAPGNSLTTAALRIDERVLHHLAGVEPLDERLAAMVKPVKAPETLAPSYRGLAGKIAALWSRQPRAGLAIPVIELCGDEAAGKRFVAAAACSLLGLRLHALPLGNAPRGASETDTFVRLWERESALSASALLIECEEAQGDPLAESAGARLAESIGAPVFLSTRSPVRWAERPRMIFEVARPGAAEQGQFWHAALEGAAACVNGQVTALVSQFSLGSEAIRAAADQALEGLPGEPREARDAQLAGRLWDACRLQARPRLEGLAQRIEPAAGWDDLVLPEKQKGILAHIAVHVRRRARVYGEWGFASKGTRGLGISALFAGPSGTGKTMAGEVLANELRLDLFRIDLSQVVSKYIGETEKNLRRVFDAAEEGAAILLFDEADALFGKRSEVKDSHDRYANIEVSYLLQRMEAYRGLAILTTNRKSALDPAFLRRIRFVVEFPFPDALLRAEIWQRVFPRETPTEGLRIDRLARLNAAGGHIRNIAMGAAFLAVDAGEPVRMSHLLRAANSEFAKMERPLADAEVAGWV
ncbi:MAG TPA: ATP-binding protein [Bryobacteraceae bacterium]|nr:ATP-binding protein [Bryobacteraceae bacterium]